MTMVCCDSPTTPSATAAPTLAGIAKAAAGRLATRFDVLASTLADHRRRRLELAALEALPFDLRKDLGWPAHDTSR
ncbi:hypothetical protein H6M51_10935 [Rhizobium sp. AQ_MP]|uniref:hypothetical protein n=1 Tax=Rhizobium sp. AQ_MP TaxID=2761536 RepID=UPI00163A7BE4|nr:hypothetical protein [Rhizobium sp. AQ_MP]MBC2773382.1 hypothetical protein [Rhizobium sp. AQ_MP]